MKFCFIFQEDSFKKLRVFRSRAAINDLGYLIKKSSALHFVYFIELRFAEKVIAEDKTR